MSNFCLSTSEIYLELEREYSQLQYLPCKFAQTALIKEVQLSPKPGLVDQWNNGSHTDMSLSTFLFSIVAITPYFDTFYAYGISHSHLEPASFLAGLRPLGIECEKAMLQATQQVNCHRGAIFAFGLILASIGKFYGEQLENLSIEILTREIANLCHGIVERELVCSNGYSLGKELYQKYALTGARGEAESGYALVKNSALPHYFTCIRKGYEQNHALLEVMLLLFSLNNDTNVVTRGGIQALSFVKKQAKQLLSTCPMPESSLITQLNIFNKKMVSLNLSPGGSADLLAVTYFFVLLSNLNNSESKVLAT